MTGAVDVQQAVCIHRTPDSEVVALRGADLVVDDGELVALVGPSGSGKSTLMAMLGGLLRPSAGRVEVLGQDIGRLPERQLLTFRNRDVGMLMQGPERNLLPYATVRANLDLAQLSTRGSRRLRRRRADDLLDAVGLADAGTRAVRTMSGGEQQRVALAVAMAGGPRLLLADEPTSQLDHANALRIAELLRETRDRLGTTVVVVTHDAELGDSMDRSLAMRDGRIGTEGRQGERLTVIGQDGTLQLPPDLLDRFPPGGRARVVRRGDHVELHPRATRVEERVERRIGGPLMTHGLQLIAEGIVLRRTGTTVLGDVAVSVPAGSMAALTGPSGSGKTTLLTVLAALERPDHGTVRYDDRPVTPATRGPWVGRVQVAHQSFGLLSLLSAAENVELALQALPHGRRPDRRTVRTAAADALAAVGLAGRADHLVEELSGGEQQRVALARAMVTGPQLLLADEPTAQLDAANRERVVALLRATADDGTTVVVATHDPDLTSVCDSVVALVDGRLLSDATAVGDR